MLLNLFCGIVRSLLNLLLSCLENFNFFKLLHVWWALQWELRCDCAPWAGCVPGGYSIMLKRMFLLNGNHCQLYLKNATASRLQCVPDALINRKLRRWLETENIGNLQYSSICVSYDERCIFKMVALHAKKRRWFTDRILVGVHTVYTT